jgi:hypothetical protein
MSGEKIQEDTASDSDLALEMTTGLLRTAIEGIPSELRNLSTSELEQLRQPSPLDYALRQNFWSAIDKAKSNGDPQIRISHVFKDVCTKQAFHLVCENPVRMAFILNRPKDDLGRLRDILQVAIGRFEHYVATSPINEKTAGHYLKAMEILMNRVHGPMVQKIEAKHAHLNMNKPIAPPNNETEVNQRLNELRAKLLPEPQNDIITQVQQHETTVEYEPVKQE